MDYKRILTIQDISCVGQCSLTVALPILSVCGIETAVLPSAVLSTHTGGFSGYTFRDLTEDMPHICKHWALEGISFDAVYTGYLGSAKQIDYVQMIYNTVAKQNALLFVDPAMADSGKLYAGFDAEFVQAMRKLCKQADFVLPNLTEACFLTETAYKTEYNEAYIHEILSRLLRLGCKNIILSGISYQNNQTGVAVLQNGKYQYYAHALLPVLCHGTGDIFASAFAGAVLRNKSVFAAAKIAADYTVACIRATEKTPEHWYGVRFEPVLPKLIEAIYA